MLSEVKVYWLSLVEDLDNTNNQKPEGENKKPIC